MRSALYAVRKDRIGIRIKNTPYRLNDTAYFYLYIRDVIPALTVSSLFCGEAHPLPPSRSALLRAKHKKNGASPTVSEKHRFFISVLY